MKLSLKIFLGICIPSIIVAMIISIIVINRNHETNIEAERQNLIQNLKSIERNLNNVDESYGKQIIQLMSNNYSSKNIHIIYYYDTVEYNNSESINPNMIDYSNVQNSEYYVEIKNIDNNHFSIATSKLDNNRYVTVEKNINEVFDKRKELIYNCIYIIAISMIIIAIIAYIISKTLTRPLERMKKEMTKLSKGDYNINLKEGHDEFGRLAKNFNNMSKELEKRNNELVEYANSKQIFIDNLSHEMNTPLTSIQGYAELMQKANLNEEQKQKYLKYIQDEGKRIQDMYKKLLLLSYKKNTDFEKKDIEMNKVFAEIEDTFKERINNAGMELIINNQLSTIYGDETLIIMSISNLIKNAMNVSDKNTKIMVNAFNMNNKKYVQVVDQGPGISEENIKKITEPFYRVDKVRSRKNGGAGLGLSICKSIMEMHGGKLIIESEIGKGSIFTLEFN
ncbi:MAG: HAMP domain-containing histidine kinase [Clostridia bacterium]|nr:HAMP domain-containing histidine kinase [Clostridia bacterium]